MSRTSFSVLELPANVDEAVSALHPAERALTSRMAPGRLRAFAAGRCALRAAARRLGHDLGAVLTTPGGAPMFPPGLVGSVSHSRNLAAALVAPAGDGHVGVDVEAGVPPAIDIARQVLSPGEWPLVARLLPGERARAVLLRFSVKEAVIKALTPLLGDAPRLHEIEVDLRPGGVAAVTCARASASGIAVAASSRLVDGMIFSAARATPGALPRDRLSWPVLPPGARASGWCLWEERA